MVQAAHYGTFTGACSIRTEELSNLSPLACFSAAAEMLLALPVLSGLSLSSRSMSRSVAASCCRRWAVSACGHNLQIVAFRAFDLKEYSVTFFRRSFSFYLPFILVVTGISVENPNLIHSLTV